MGISGGTSLREQLKLKLAPSLASRPQRNSFCPTGTLRSLLITMKWGQKGRTSCFCKKRARGQLRLDSVLPQPSCPHERLCEMLWQRLPLDCQQRYVQEDGLGKHRKTLAAYYNHPRHHQNWDLKTVRSTTRFGILVNMLRYH